MADDDDTSDGSFSDDSLFRSDSSFGYSFDSSTYGSISTVESDTDVVGVRKRKHNTSPRRRLNSLDQHEQAELEALDDYGTTLLVEFEMIVGVLYSFFLQWIAARIHNLQSKMIGLQATMLVIQMHLLELENEMQVVVDAEICRRALFRYEVADLEVFPWNC